MNTENLNMPAIEKLVTLYQKKNQYADLNSFIESANRYLSASRENRLMCNIEHVSSSLMTRRMSFFEMKKSDASDQHFILNFYSLFETFGFKPVTNGRSFKISGCGMDMVFNTHYTIIYKLHSLGFIDENECGVLAQKTPHKV